MSGGYPPGVTGSEYEIAGPDFEEEIECPRCNKIAIKQGYRDHWWINCDECGYYEDGYFSDDWPDYYFELSRER